MEDCINMDFLIATFSAVVSIIFGYIVWICTRGWAVTYFDSGYMSLWFIFLILVFWYLKPKRKKSQEKN